MIKKEEDKIEYALKKVSIFLSPDRASFDLFIQKIIRGGTTKQKAIKSPYSSPVWFLEKKFVLFKMAPATLVLAIAIFVGLPEITNNNEAGIATEIIKDLGNEEFSFSSTEEEDALFDEIENSDFDELASLSFYEE
jgi:hypothetical protein